MVKFIRSLKIFSIVVLLATQYQNCSSYNDNSLFDAKTEASTCPSGDCPTIDPEALNIKVSYPVLNNGHIIVEGYEDQLQLSGICSDGFAANNVIEVRIKDRNAVDQVIYKDDSGTEFTFARDIRCENGKFFALIPILKDIDTTRGNNFTLYFNMKTYDEKGQQIKDSSDFPGVAFVINDSPD